MVKHTVSHVEGRENLTDELAGRGKHVLSDWCWLLVKQLAQDPVVHLHQVEEVGLTRRSATAELIPGGHGGFATPRQVAQEAGAVVAGQVLQPIHRSTARCARVAPRGVRGAHGWGERGVDGHRGHVDDDAHQVELERAQNG